MWHDNPPESLADRELSVDPNGMRGVVAGTPSVEHYATRQTVSRENRTFHNHISERTLRTMTTRHENATGDRRLELNERAA